MAGKNPAFWAHVVAGGTFAINLCGLLTIIFIGGRWMGTTNEKLGSIDEKVSAISEASGAGDLRHDGEIRRALETVSKHEGRFETLEMKIEGVSDRIEMKVDELESHVDRLERGGAS